jgi:ABC-type multidrug transport system permease subunit
MHITDSIWIFYSVFVFCAAVFFLVFAYLVKRKGG